MTIPNNPSLNEQWTNDITGVTYQWDGDRWIILSNADEVLEDYVTLEEFDKDQKRQDDVIKDITTAFKLTRSCKVTRTLNNAQGDMWTMMLDPTLVYTLIFNPIDLNSEHLPTLGENDYIDITNTSGQTNHYRVSRLNATDPGHTYTVEFLYGDGEWTDNETVSVDFIGDDDHDESILTRIIQGEETQDNILEEQEVQNTQINALETQIQLLAQAKAVGTWRYERNMSGSSPRPPATATFYGTKANDPSGILLNWSDAFLIMVNKEDLNGAEFTFNEFEAGDKIEIISLTGSDACYGTVTQDVTQTAYGNFVIDVERSKGGPLEGASYLISAYRPGSSTEDIDVLDQRYLVKTGDTMEGTLKTEGEVRFELPGGTGGVSRMRLMATKKDPDGNGGNSFAFTSHPEPTGILSNAKIHINISHTEEDGPVTKLRFLADPEHDDSAISLGYANTSYLKLSGGTLDGTLSFKRGTKDTQQFKISPNSSDDFATNIYSFNNGQMRFRTTTGTDEQPYDTHIILDQNSGSPETKIYKVITPTKDDMAANKAYVDAQAGIPVGSIMMWINATAPEGWFKLKGYGFDISLYPKLHAYLQQSDGYVPGVLPDWRGHYPGQIGDHLSGDVGVKLGQRTAMPDAGAPYHPNSIPNGNTRTFNGSGGTNAYSDGAARPAITEGWDEVTRPKTVAVHFIIKHD